MKIVSSTNYINQKPYNNSKIAFGALKAKYVFINPEDEIIPLTQSNFIKKLIDAINSRNPLSKENKKNIKVWFNNQSAFNTQNLYTLNEQKFNDSKVISLTISEHNDPFSVRIYEPDTDKFISTVKDDLTKLTTLSSNIMEKLPKIGAN